MTTEPFTPADDLFVITAKGVSELSTPVLSVGGAGQSDGVAVFESRDAAGTYLHDSGWSETDTIAEITPQAIVKWLVAVRADGPEFLIVNPRRSEQEDGTPQSVLRIDDLLSELGCIAVTRVTEEREPIPSVTVSHMVTRCLKCGRVERRTTSQKLLECCGRTMVAESLETRSVPVRS